MFESSVLVKLSGTVLAGLVSEASEFVVEKSGWNETTSFEFEAAPILEAEGLDGSEREGRVGLACGLEGEGRMCCERRETGDLIF